MTAVFSAPDATVIGSVLALVGALAALWAQNRRTHRENRSDHAIVAKVVADTAAKVDRLVDGQIDIKGDVADIKAEVRHHGERLRHLEAVVPAKPTPRPRKKAV